jgi:hypothetical protein
MIEAYSVLTFSSGNVEVSLSDEVLMYPKPVELEGFEYVLRSET